MEIIQIIGIAIISTILCLFIKKDRPEFANFIAITAGVIILLSVILKLNFIVEEINKLADRANIPSMYISLIIKLIGIAYIMEFAVSLCKDCGENNIASKLEFGGKIIIMSMSFPILLSIIDAIIGIIPRRKIMKNKLKIVLITLFFIISMNNISFASQNDENKNDLSTEEYEVSNETSQNYINKQLEKINIGQLEQELKNNELFKDLNLKQYIKDLIKGEAKLTDLINIQSLKNLILQQLSASLKVIIMIIVLALLSSILKSLESSFSSGEVTKIVNYIIFITMVTLVLVNFKDVLSIAYTTVNSIISIVNILIPILLSLMVVGGLTATSATLSPVFVGGVSVINLVFKNIIFTLITLAFCVLVVNNLSKNIKLKRFSELLKKANIVIVGAVFIIYLGLISIQGIYVTSFDKFTVKSAKFAVGSFIPVIGNFVSDSVDILLSSSLLIKNILEV